MDELDLSMRAPYISMSEVDDLPLLTSDDLLWGVPAAAIEGNATGTSISAFGLSGKFFIKDEFTAIGSAANGTETGSSSLADPPAASLPHTVQHSLPVDKEHSLLLSAVVDTIAANGAGSVAGSSSGSNDLPTTNNSNNDSKSTAPSAASSAASIDSSLAALLCGGNVISIQSDTSNLSQQQSIGNQLLISHTNAGSQQEQRHNNQPQPQQSNLQQQQQQSSLNGSQQRQQEAGPKRIKLSEHNLLPHSMVVLPANVKLCKSC